MSNFQQGTKLLNKSQHLIKSFHVSPFISLVYKNESGEVQQNKVAFSNISQQFYVCCADDKINIIEYATGERLYTIQADSNVNCISLSSDDRFLAVSCKSGQVTIYSMKQLKALRTLRVGVSSPVIHLAYSPDDTFLAMAHGDGSIDIYLTTGDQEEETTTSQQQNFTKLLFTIRKHHQAQIHLMKWIDNLWLASCGLDGVKIVQIGNEEDESRPFKIIAKLHDNRNDIREVILLKEEESESESRPVYLFTAGYGSLYQFTWTSNAFTLSKTIPIKHYVTSLTEIKTIEKSFTLVGCTPVKKKNNLIRVKVKKPTAQEKQSNKKKSDNSDLVDEGVKVEYIPEKSIIGLSQLFKISDSEIFAVTVDSNFAIFKQVTKDDNNNSKVNLKKKLGKKEDVTEIASSGLLFEKTGQRLGFNDDILDMALFTSRNMLAVATNSENIILMNVKDANQDPFEIVGHTEMVLSMDRSKDKEQRYLVTGSKDKTVRVWDVSKYGNTNGDDFVTPVAVGTSHLSGVTAVCVSNHKRKVNDSDVEDFSIFSASDDGVVKKWQLSNCNLLGTTAECHKKTVSEIAISPDDSLIATASADKTAKVLDANDLKVVFEFPHKRAVWCVKFSPVDKVLATGCSDNNIRIWSLKTGNCVKVLEGHDTSVLKMQFLNNGSQLISADANGVVRLWVIKTGECIKVFGDAHKDRIWAIAVDHKTNQLITGGEDSIINIWEDNTEEIKEEQRKEVDLSVIQDQELRNLERQGKMKDVLKKAIELDRPKLTYSTIEKLIKTDEKKVLDALILELPKLHLMHLFQYCIDWNSNSKFSQIAQLVLKTMFDLLDPSFVDIAYEKSVDALTLYSQRHLKRISYLEQKSFILEHALNQMNALTPLHSTSSRNNNNIETLKELSKKRKEMSNIHDGEQSKKVTKQPLQIKTVEVVDEDVEFSDYGEMDDDAEEGDDEQQAISHEPSLKKVKQ
ncbi:hypothetical protein FDP41_010050 [Naegleria fowleri]|uniref:U3 small nucleolar RNA-associated protein 13 C-terminal domain-containing protein n=1 Tax=Naegleria fowleri TaxID=5763 RepID=A0A6A5AZC9_NAEFO|nr:uncharacterized protein FDP41_010050 [Naegleria fowleri]KAF0971827.1 hypothetical protein FDP41_010050 [Naegleria fowleri]